MVVLAVMACGDNTPGIIVDAPLGSEPLEPAMVTASPGSVDFGSVVQTTEAFASVTVTNVGQTTSGPVLTNITGSGASLFSSVGTPCTTLGPGAMCTVSLRFTPTTPGPKQADLQLSASPGGMVMIPLAGTGLSGPGGLNVSPTLNDFGTVAMGTTSPARTFTFTNPSGSTFGALTITPAGTNAQDYAITSQTCSGAMLAPGGACTIDVAFTPTLAGVRTAAFVAHALPGGTANASVTGTGQ